MRPLHSAAVLAILLLSSAGGLGGCTDVPSYEGTPVRSVMDSASVPKKKKKKETVKETETVDPCACADEADCPATPPEDCAPPDDEEEEVPAPAPAPAPAQTAAETAFAAVFDQLSPTCSRCHATGANGAPTYMGATAAASYPLFKARGFHREPSALLTKDIHAGPGLEATQSAAIKKWIAAEASP